MLLFCYFPNLDYLMYKEKINLFFQIKAAICNCVLEIPVALIFPWNRDRCLSLSLA